MSDLWNQSDSETESYSNELSEDESPIDLVFGNFDLVYKIWNYLLNYQPNELRSQQLASNPNYNVYQSERSKIKYPSNFQHPIKKQRNQIDHHTLAQFLILRSVSPLWKKMSQYHLYTRFFQNLKYRWKVTLLATQGKIIKIEDPDFLVTEVVIQMNCQKKQKTDVNSYGIQYSGLLSFGDSNELAPMRLQLPKLKTPVGLRTNPSTMKQMILLELDPYQLTVSRIMDFFDQLISKINQINDGKYVPTPIFSQYPDLKHPVMSLPLNEQTRCFSSQPPHYQLDFTDDNLPAEANVSAIIEISKYYITSNDKILIPYRVLQVQLHEPIPKYILNLDNYLFR